MRRSSIFVSLGLLAVAGCGGSTASGGSGTAAPHARKRAQTRGKRAAASVTLTDAKSRFRITVPQGYGLAVHKGVYVMRKGTATLTYSRVTTPTSTSAYRDALRHDAGAGLDDSFVGRD